MVSNCSPNSTGKTQEWNPKSQLNFLCSQTRTGNPAISIALAESNSGPLVALAVVDPRWQIERDHRKSRLPVLLILEGNNVLMALGSRLQLEFSR